MSMANHWLRRQSARPEPRSIMFTQKGMVVTEATAATKVDVGRVLPRKSGQTAELEVTETAIFFRCLLWFYSRK